MAKNKCPRNHNIHAGERLPERISRVDDLEVYKANLEIALNNKEKPKVVKPDIVKAGDLVYVGGHIEEVERVLDKDRMIVSIRGAKVGGCRLLPAAFQKAWESAKKDMGIA
jgi:hypothetical protein